MDLAKIVAFSVVVWGCSGGAWAVLSVDDFVAMRLIRDPYADDNITAIRLDGTHYRTGGISNAGDIFGDAVWPHDPEHREHFEQAVRWLRSTGYEPEPVNGGQEHVLHRNHGGAPDATAPAGEAYYGLLNGWHRETPGQRHSGVSPEGMATGVVHADVREDWASFLPYAYDIRNDVLTVLPRGFPTDINNQNLMTQVWSSCCGAHSDGYYSKVTSLDAPDADPAFEVAGWKPTFTNTDPFPFGINNQNIIVGNMGSIFGDDRIPMKQLPTGVNTWSDPIPLETLESAGAEGGTILAKASVLDISNNVVRPFGAGVAGSPQNHGVVWDINAGTIVADFGPLTEAFQISGDGTKVAGVRKRFFPPGQTPTVWSTDNGWADFIELDLSEALDEKLGLAGSEIWVELTSMNGVNDSGQAVGIGIYLDKAGFEQQGVFLLDTLALAAVLAGDVNNDAEVNNLDITAFIAALAAADEAAFLATFPQGSYAAADIDGSGSPDNIDITPFIDILTAAASDSAAIPEPASGMLLLLPLMAMRRTRRRRG